MYKDCTIKYIGETHSKLLEAKISFYRIAKVLSEPEPTIHNIFKSEKAKYSEERVIEIMDRINSHIDELNSDLESHETGSPDLFIKLYALGLDSKAFTPDEKYKLAVAYKKLTDSKIKK